MWIADFYREAGILAFPITFLGGAALWFSIASARSGRSDQRALAVGLNVATVILGVLGATLGFQLALSFLKTLSPEKRYIIGIGLREALNDLVLSLALVLASTLILTWRAYRSRMGARAIGAPVGDSLPAA